MMTGSEMKKLKLSAKKFYGVTHSSCTQTAMTEVEEKNGQEPISADITAYFTPSRNI